MSIIIKNWKAKYYVAPPPPPLPPDPNKYVSLINNATNYTYATAGTNYDNFNKLVTTIETYYGVGVAGIAQVKITLATASTLITETINVDKANTTVFWNDIRGWLFMNNSTLIELFEAKYKITDINTYIILQ